MITIKKIAPGSDFLFLKILASLPIVFSFTYFLRFSLAKIGSVNLLDILLFLFIFYSFFLLKKKSLFNHFQIFLKKNLLFFLLFCLFFLFSFFSVLYSHIFWDSLGLWKSFFLLPFSFAYFLFFWTQQAFFKKQFILNLLWFSLLFFTLGSCYYWLKNWLSYDQRLSFIFSSPNQLALTITPILFIGWEKIKKKWKKKHLLFFSLNSSLFLLTLLVLWKTHSLGAWLAFFLTIFFNLFFSFSLQKKKFILNSFLFFLISTLFIIFSWTFLLENFSYQPKKPSSSLDSRIIIWQVSEKILRENWFWGIGLGNFQNVYLSYQKYFPPYPQWAVPHAHNLFFNLWIELGFLPFLFFISLLIFLFFYQEKNVPQEHSSIFFILLIFFLVYGLFETTLWKNDSALIFWICLIFSQIDSKKTSCNPINKK